MSDPTRVSGAITITPPLQWPEFKASPLYNADYDVSEVKLQVTETAVDTDEGQAIRRTAIGLVPSVEESFSFYNLVEHIQAAIDAFPGREFGGRLECKDHWGEYRVQVRDGRAVKVEPEIAWPDDETADAPATIWTAYEEDGNGELYATEAIAKAGAIAIWAETCRENAETTSGPYSWKACKYSGQELIDGTDHTSVFVTEQPVHAAPVDYTAMRPCGCPARLDHHNYGCKES